MRRHREGDALIAAPPEAVFSFVDDHSRLSSHMSESSWMMGGGRMQVELDAAKGQAVGSHIRLAGSAFGMRLSLDEVITQREPPSVKVWETVGAPRLLIIGAYRMGVEIAATRDGSRLRVFIDYDLPSGPITRWLGVCLGGMYARWCVKQMLSSAAAEFPRAAVIHSHA